MPILDQTDCAVPGISAIQSVSFFITQESGEPAQYHLVVLNLAEGKLMEVKLDRVQAQKLGEVIRTATGP